MRKQLFIITGFIGCLILTSCHVYKYPADAGTIYNRQNEMKVKVKDGLLSSKHISFGDYSTGDKGNGLLKGSNAGNIPHAQNTFNFNFHYLNNVTTVQCLTTTPASLKETNLPYAIMGGTNPLFYVLLSSGNLNTLKNWEMIIKSPTGSEIAQHTNIGILRSLTDNIDISAQDPFDNGSASTDNMTYEFKMQGLAIAAVQINGKQKVWMSENLDAETRLVTGAAIAALLMR